MVFYLLECMVLIMWYLLYCKTKPEIKKRIYDPWGFWKGYN
jgi:hypothetical protein